MQEIQDICCGRAKSLDAALINCVDRRQDLRLAIAACAGLQKACKSHLVVAVLVNIRDPKLRLPQESVIRPLEDLPLLGDGADDGFERRSFVLTAERVCFDFLHNRCDTTSNGAKVLQAFVPEKPGLISSPWIFFPSTKQLMSWVHRRLIHGFRQPGEGVLLERMPTGAPDKKANSA